MKAWHFSENAYPYLPPADEYELIRVTLPNRIYDPRKGAALYDRFIDEWLIAEDEGVEIMLNEHHQTATCVDPAAPLVLAALARLSRRARLLILGNPVANRRQPVRVAEEMAMIDVLSKGRLECGFVRGVPYEVSPANTNPVRMNERQWEAMDLIVKAWTSHDGPFSHEGRFFHHRMSNLAAALAAAASADLGEHDDAGRGATGRRARLCAGDVSYRLQGDARDLRRLSQGLARRRPRRGCCGQPACLCGAGLCRAERSEGAAGAEKLLWYVTSNKVPPHFSNPPGYVPVAGQVKMLRGAPVDQHAGIRASATVEKAIAAGIMFAGTPDQVYRQIKTIYDHVGGFGHLLIMGQAGFLEHDDTVLGIRTFAREVYPRLREDFPDAAISGPEQRVAAPA